MCALPGLMTNSVWWDWSWKARFIKDKNKRAAGYVSSSLMVCTAPILFSKIIVNEKNWCDVFICLQYQSDKDAIIKRCTLSSPKKQIKTCNREV